MGRAELPGLSEFGAVWLGGSARGGAYADRVDVFYDGHLFSQPMVRDATSPTGRQARAAVDAYLARRSRLGRGRRPFGVDANVVAIQVLVQFGAMTGRLFRGWTGRDVGVLRRLATLGVVSRWEFAPVDPVVGRTPSVFRLGERSVVERFLAPYPLDVQLLLLGLPERPSSVRHDLLVFDLAGWLAEVAPVTWVQGGDRVAPWFTREQRARWTLRPRLLVRFDAAVRVAGELALVWVVVAWRAQPVIEAVWRAQLMAAQRAMRGVVVVASHEGVTLAAEARKATVNVWDNPYLRRSGVGDELLDPDSPRRARDRPARMSDLNDVRDAVTVIGWTEWFPARREGDLDRVMADLAGGPLRLAGWWQRQPISDVELGWQELA